MSEPSMSGTHRSERTLIALHGNFASARWWAALRVQPPAGWRVLAPDLPGFAGTAHTGEVSIAAYADWVSTWLTAQKVSRPVLLGHSLGGAVALELAARDAQAYTGLVLAASAPLSGLETPEVHYPVLELLRTTPALLGSSLSALFPSNRPANFADLVADGARMAATHYSGNARALAAWRVEPGALRDLPVLVLGGELDALIPPSLVQAQAQALGTEAVLFPGRGHGFPQEDPAGFLAQLQPFLDTL